MTLLSLSPLYNRMFDFVDYSFDDLYQEVDKNGTLNMEFDLPGVKKEDVKLSIKNNTLEIKAERNGKKVSIEKRYLLPKGLDTDNLTAKMEDGVLYISVPPKVQEKEKTKIVKIE